MSRRPLAPRLRPAPPAPPEQRAAQPDPAVGASAPEDRAPAEGPEGFSTQAPVTQAPVTQGPATEGPATEGPDTEGPDTEGPDTECPATDGPATGGTDTEGPATGGTGPVVPGPEADGTSRSRARPASSPPPRPRGGASPAVPGRGGPGRPGAPGPVHLRPSSPRSTAPPSGEASAALLRVRRRGEAPGGGADSAHRFAERARRRRRSALAPLLVGLAALLVLAGLAYVVLWSSLLAVREVGVLGLERLDRQVVTDVVEPSRGTPLARVDTASLEERLETVPLVESAVVARAWPSRLEVRLVERVPVAAVAAPGGGYSVVDRTGLTVLSSPDVPADVPLVEVDLEAAGPATVEAVAQVLDELPPELRPEVATAGGTSRDDVVLVLRSGARVVWGGADSTPLKAEVLAALLQRPAAVYDVSSPSAPVTRAG